MAKSKKKAILEPEEPEEPEEESDVKTPPKGKGNIPYDVFEKALDNACITFAVCSKRNTGKTFMTRQLIRHLAPKYFSNIVVFSKTSHLNGDHDYTENVINNFDEPTVRRILDYQQARTLKNRTAKKPVNVKILVVLDDTIGVVNDGSKRTNHSDALDEIYSAGRHSGITLFQSTQFASKISPTQRANFDFLCIGITSEDSLQKLHGCTVGKPYKEFRQYIHENTRDHNFVLYNNLTTNDDERWTIIRADPNPKKFVLKSNGVTKSKRSKQIQL